MGNRRQRAAVIVVVLGSIIVTLLGVQSPSGAQPPPSRTVGSISVSPAAGVVGQHVVVSGKLPGGTKRKAALERSVGGSWTTVGKANTSKRGGYSFDTSLPSLGTVRYRVRAAAKRLATGRTLPAAKTKTVSVVVGNAPILDPVPQTATLTGPASTFVNKPFILTAGFSPARPGRAVVIEQYASGAWAPVSTLVQDHAGAATANLTVTAPGSQRYRATTLAADGLGAYSSSQTDVVVAPDPVQVADTLEPLSAAEVSAIDSYDQSSGTLVFGSDAPASVAQIDVGDVVPVPPREDLLSGALVRVTSETTSGTATTMATTPVGLPDVVENVPDDATDVAMLPLGDPVATDLASGVTLEPAEVSSRDPGLASVNIDGDPIQVSIDKTLTQHVGGVTLSAQLAGQVSVTPTVEVGLDMDWLTLKSYHVAAGLKTSESVTLSVSAGASKSWDVDLFKMSMTRGGFIGPVPVWVTFEGTVKLHVGISGEVKASVTWSRTGLFMSGLKGTQTDNYTPRPYESRATSTGRLSRAGASGHAEGRITAAAQLSLYSLIGPYAEIGYEAVADVRTASGSSLTCEVYHRPVAAVGIRTSEALERLTGKQFTPLSHDFSFTKQMIYSCPPNGGGAWATVRSNGPASCGIRTDGTGWCWGGGAAAPSPTLLPGTWSSLAPSSTTCGVRTDGSGWCWGYNGWGAIGDGTTTDRASPTRLPGTWSSLESNGGLTCGVRTDRSGWCWGWNNRGQVGDGTLTDRTTPTRLPGAWSKLETSRVYQYGVTTCGVRTDGSGWCWGGNEGGQVGDGTTIDRTSPTRLPGTWSSLRPEPGNTCGVQVGGSGWCWGGNNNGQVGDGTSGTSRPLPTRVPGTWASLAPNESTTCGVRTDGSGWCWGYNFGGQVGDGTTIDRTSPTRLPGTWSSLEPSYYTTCGVRTDSSGWCWGLNHAGQVGDGTTTNRTSPTRVSGVWASVQPAYYTTCGVRTDASGWCWGSNEYGQVGDGTTTNRPSPTRVH